MRFAETLENRTLMSSTTPTLPWANFTGNVLPALFVPQVWAADFSAAPEAPPTWINTITGKSITAPLLSPSGRLQISGTTKADQISVEQVTGLDPSSDLPAFILDSDRPEFFQSVADASGNGSYTFLGGWSSSYTGAQPGSIGTEGYDIDFVDSQNDQVPDLYGHLGPPSTLLAQYQQQEQLLGDSDDGLRIRDMGIPGVNVAVDQYNQKVAKYAKVNMTRVRVAGLYDVYVMGSTPITIAIDSGAGNDTISVAANVNDKTSILGGKGNDMLISGKMHTYLAGGAGNDVLVSRSKHGGTLDGGPGTDTFDSRFGSTLVADANSSDFVDIRGQSYPMATAAASSKISMKNTTFSQIFVTPDGLV